MRRRNTEAALREALEPIRVARMSPPGQDESARSTWSRAHRPRAVWRASRSRATSAGTGSIHIVQKRGRSRSGRVAGPRQVTV